MTILKKDWQGNEDGIWRYKCVKCGEFNIEEEDKENHKCKEK